MTHIALVSFIFLQVTISIITAEAPETNGGKEYECESRNAVKTDCATDCDIERCPLNNNYSRQCDNKCKPGCKCGFNEKFASNGTCIATQLCPPFNCDLPNEEYVACPSYYCGDGCSQGCLFGFMLMVVECFPECRCKEGFGRKDGLCVRNEECYL